MELLIQMTTITLRGSCDETKDRNGNAVFIFMGQSCASGTSEVMADVLAGTHPTYVTDFTVDPPAPTM
jgi:hypothetical protein